MPVEVDRSVTLAGKTVIAIAAGTYHNLALCSDGTIAAWGRGLEGQLGNNSGTNSLIPVAVSRTGSSFLVNRKPVVIAAGAYHSLTACSDGLAAAWGNNADGQLGTGNNMSYSLPMGVKTTSSALSGKKVTFLPLTSIWQAKESSAI